MQQWLMRSHIHSLSLSLSLSLFLYQYVARRAESSQKVRFSGKLRGFRRKCMNKVMCTYQWYHTSYWGFSFPLPLFTGLGASKDFGFHIDITSAQKRREGGQKCHQICGQTGHKFWAKRGILKLCGHHIWKPLSALRSREVAEGEGDWLSSESQHWTNKRVIALETRRGPGEN